ncbi:MAG: hypothetical protein AAGD40_06910 [Pseudomonadota bacterium]
MFSHLAKPSQLAAACLLTALPVGSAAQDPDPADEEIVVVAPVRATEKERMKTYVAKTGIVYGQRQAARWEDPVCPTVKGLIEEQKALVETWIREAAALGNVPVAKPGCDSSTLVAFTNDGPALLQKLRGKKTETVREDEA